MSEAGPDHRLDSKQNKDICNTEYSRSEGEVPRMTESRRTYLVYNTSSRRELVRVRCSRMTQRSGGTGTRRGIMRSVRSIASFTRTTEKHVHGTRKSTPNTQVHLIFCFPRLALWHKECYTKLDILPSVRMFSNVRRLNHIRPRLLVYKQIHCGMARHPEN